MLPCRNQDRAGRRLADAQTFRRHLDAVVDRVANQVHQRIGDLLNDPLLEFGLAALDGQLDLLVEGPRQVAHGAWERLEHRRERQHRQLDDVLAQLFGNVGEPHAVVAEVGQQQAHAAPNRLKGIGVLAEFLGPALRRRRQSPFAQPIPQAAHLRLFASQLVVARGGLEALQDHLRREHGQAFELLEGHAQRMTEGGPLAGRRRRFGLGPCLDRGSGRLHGSLRGLRFRCHGQCRQSAAEVGGVNLRLDAKGQLLHPRGDDVQ